MANKIDIVTSCFEKMGSEGPDEAISQAASDDFRLIAGTWEIDRKGFINLLAGVYAAIPDLKHSLSDIQERGDTVQLTYRPTGTFTHAWDGTSYGLPILEPSGEAFFMAPMRWEITVRNGKITRWHDVTVPSAASGLAGFFKALGVVPLPVKRSHS